MHKTSVLENGVCKADTSTFDLCFGASVQIEPAGLGYKLQSYFIGMVKYKYIIVRLSPLGLDWKNVYATLYRDNETKLFYTREGVLHGYMSKVLSYITTPHRHVYLTYPHEAELFTLRGHTRHQCHVPARVRLDDLELSGMALNFSTGGCCVCVSVPEERREDIGVDKLIHVGCSLVSAQGVSHSVCRVRNVREARGKLVLGLSFEEISESSMNRVEAFLEHLGRYS